LILISCRKDFSDSRAFAGANAIRNYHFCHGSIHSSNWMKAAWPIRLTHPGAEGGRFEPNKE
jgi:hypothetical protein